MDIKCCSTCEHNVRYSNGDGALNDCECFSSSSISDERANEFKCCYYKPKEALWLKDEKSKFASFCNPYRKCSACGELVYSPVGFKYCPICGVKIKQEEN